MILRYVPTGKATKPPVKKVSPSQREQLVKAVAALGYPKTAEVMVLKAMRHRSRRTGTPILVRLQPDVLEWLDKLCNAETPPISRAEMIRRKLNDARGNGGEG